MDNLEVIYVEDDEQEAFIMTVGMRRQGIRIVHVGDLTFDNADLLRESPFDQAHALIFDAILTGASGVEMAEKLRQNGESRPIFLLTAAGNPDPRLLASLDIRYMRKPPDYRTLASAIRSLIDD